MIVFRWLMDRIGWQTSLAGSLVALGLIATALGLSSLVRGLEPGLTLTVALLAAAAGCAAAWKRLRPAAGLGLLFLAGLAVLTVRLAGLGPKIILALGAVLQLAASSQAWLIQGMPDGLLLREAGTSIAASLGAVLTRFSTWLSGAARGAPVFDPLVPAFLWGLAIWIISAWAGWSLRRGYRGLPVFLPAAVLLSAACGYTAANPLYLVGLLLAILLLTVLIDQLKRERRWSSAGIDFTLEIRSDLALSAGSLGVLLVVLSMIVPFIQPGAIARSVQTLTTSRQPAADSVVRSIGLEPRPAPVSPLNSYYMPGLPRQHLIGSGPELSGRVVMTVSVTDESPEHIVVDSVEQPRFYWRGFTYDRYTGYGWLTSQTSARDYSAGTQLREVDLAKERRIRQVFGGKEDLMGVLYGAGEILSVDHAFTIERRSDPDMFAGIVRTNTYQVEAVLPDTRPQTLSKAGRDYPGWVKTRYLQLPENIPARVLGLARDLTAAAVTPYDQARAIETYLRKFPYTLDLPAPPPITELADYFIFQLKKGYCDYYATAMVVLARASGLPARLATGFASGSYDPKEGWFTVTEADAHSWPEIYFPGSGWTPFEPTAGRLSASEPPVFGSNAPQFPPLGEGQTVGMPGAGPSPALPPVLLWAGSAAALALAGWAGLRLRKREHQPQPAAPYRTLAGWYCAICRSGSRLGANIHRSDTPLEVSQKLSGCLERFAHKGILRGSIEPASSEIHALVEGYIQTAYSPNPSSPAELANLGKVWSKLRVRLWLAVIENDSFPAQEPLMTPGSPRYSLKSGLVLQIIGCALKGKKRSFHQDARELVSGISSFRVSGKIPDPGEFSRGCLLVVNHYHRPGFRSWWIAAAASAAFPTSLHWVMTDTFTYPDRIRGTIASPLSTWFLRRIARMYGFTSMPPMPPRKQDQAVRGIAVRSLLRYARETRQPAIGLAPEGRDSPNGTLLDLPSGVGKLVANLAESGLVVIPAGIFERGGALYVHFGLPVALPDSLEIRSPACDRQVSAQIREALARCLPDELRPSLKNPIFSPEVEPCSELPFGN